MIAVDPKSGTTAPGAADAAAPAAAPADDDDGATNQLLGPVRSPNCCNVATLFAHCGQQIEIIWRKIVIFTLQRRDKGREGEGGR